MSPLSTRRRKLFVYGGAALLALAIFAMAVFGALAVYSGDQARAENCEQIELLKDQLRPKPFDLIETTEILEDLGIQPESEQGKRLIARSIKNNKAARERLAPVDC